MDPQKPPYLTVHPYGVSDNEFPLIDMGGGGGEGGGVYDNDRCPRLVIMNSHLKAICDGLPVL